MVSQQNYQRTSPLNGFGVSPAAVAIPSDITRAVEVMRIPNARALSVWNRLIQTDHERQQIIGTIATVVDGQSVQPPLQFNEAVPVMLIHGEPGVGKTERSYGAPSEWAKNHHATGIQLMIKARELGSDGLGQMPKNVAALFDLIKQYVALGLQVFPTVQEVEDLYLDRDAINSRTNPVDVERAVTAAIQGLDELLLCPNVFWIWTTNRAHRIDAAVRSRTPFRIDIPPLTDPIQRELVRRACVELVERGLSPKLSIEAFDAAWPQLASRLVGLSGRDLKSLAMQAAVPAGGYRHLTVEHLAQTAVELADRRNREREASRSEY